jgi:hypothetical protein
MTNIIFFKSRSEFDAEQNIKDFVSHCRDNLTLYEDQGGFNVNIWRYDDGRKKHAMAFSKYTTVKNSYQGEPFDEPFMSFAKSYIRYSQSNKEVSSISNKIVLLRALHDALLAVHDIADVLKTDGLVQSKVTELLNKRYPGSDILFRVGGQTKLLYEFLVDKAFTLTLPIWKNPWKRPKNKAGRTDKNSSAWQDERCPSMHQMLSLAHCFANAETIKDKYWSSVISLLMFAPGRGGELSGLTVDSMHEEAGRIGVRWYAEKGFGHTVKWVPKAMEETVREAFRRLIEIGQTARDAAKFAHENPGVFYRHQDCITPLHFPENKPLNALQFAHAMNFGLGTVEGIEALGNGFNSPTAWDYFRKPRWIEELRKDNNPTYHELAAYVQCTYKNKNWPNLVKIKRPVWESLILVRDREFHSNVLPRSFSWVIPGVNQLNDQLNKRVENHPTIFERFGLVDEDGSNIELTSHQLRVWLSTNAERGGMDAWKLAQWAGRARIEDNKHYDLRTQEEREQQVRMVLKLETRPSALEAIKMNLPVSYADLGLNRIGIVDVTEYGMCTHDYAMSPCSKAGECMNCKEHVCIKGMPKTLERIKRLEEQVESQLQKARKDTGEEVFGADRWETHLGWKLAHIRTLRQKLESEDVPEGTVLWIPPEHDPSPVKRALMQQQYSTKIQKDELVDKSVITGLLGAMNA